MYKVIYKIESDYKAICVSDLFTAYVLAEGMDGIVLRAVVMQ